MTEPARVICGDMRAVLATLPPESVHAIVTDPPYGLAFMGKAWDQQVPGPEYWRECLRVAKPGAHLIAFGGTRTAHRLACAIEDAGWELRDCLSWLYGSGFPKSHNLDGEWDGWGTALKPAWEPGYIARKQFKGSVASCACEHRCGALNIDGCRIGNEKLCAHGGGRNVERVYGGGIGIPALTAGSNAHVGRWPANLALDEAAAALLDAQTGDQSYADRGGPSRFFYTAKASRAEREAGLERFESRNVNDGRDTPIDNPYQRGDTQRRNVHPTVKPVSLMRWLVRLITPPGGTVLDPFTGSGTTGVAAVLEGARFIGCELSPEYAELARARIAHAADEDDGPQLTLFERAELKSPAPRATQGAFVWTDENERDET